MRTQDLVSRLAGDLAPVARNAVARTLNRALTLGLIGDTVLLVALYGLRSDMPTLIWEPMFWARLAFPLAIIAFALKLAERLARPGAPLRLAWFAALVPVMTMLLAGACILFAAPAGYRLQLMLDKTWWAATVSIILISLPSLATAMHAMKALAPTRLVLAGAGAGLLAGAQGLLVFSLYCSDMALPFWGIGYALALAVTSGIGAALGRNYLRW